MSERNNNQGRQNRNDSRKKKNNTSKSSSSSTSSFSWGAKVHTLDTVNDFSNYTSSRSNNTAGTGSTSTSSSFVKTQHIPNLPLSSQAQQILQRIQNEFQPIIQRRGYNVTSVTEMCCCDDGFNYLHNDGNSNANNTKRKRKIKNMPNNVLGYNLTSGYRRPTTNQSNYQSASIHRIHLRLRPPTNHTSSFYPYDDIAGTMCHELAHCEISQHNAKFYKLMDEIMDQYQLSLINGGFVLDKNGFPMNSDQAYVLGGSSNSSKKGESGNAAQLRWEQRKKFGLGGTYILGTAQTKNDNTTSSSSLSNKSSLANLPPKEAARIAAERRIEERRRNDSKYCLPCQDIIEILDDSCSDDDSDDDNNKENDDKNIHAHGKSSNLKSEKDNFVDVIVIDDNDDNENFMSQYTKSRIDNAETKCKKATLDIIDLSYDNHYNSQQSCSNRRKSSNENVTENMKEIHQGLHSFKSERDNNTHWSCIICTYAGNIELALSCNICGSERTCTNYETQKEIDKIVRQDLIDDIKRKEVEQSKKDFNGFNIYGNTKQSSSTMNHLT